MSSESVVFVADVHIVSGSRPEGASAPANRFLEFLKCLPGRCRGLFILGDLFEVWVGHADAEAPDYRRVLDALAELEGAGVSLAFISGNRDFLLSDYLLENSGWPAYADRVTIELDGKQVQLSHGDLLCARDWQHLMLRGILRSWIFRKLFLALPRSLAGRLADGLRRFSRIALRSKRPEALGLDERELRRTFHGGVDVIICGHTHRGLHRTFEVDGRRCELFVLDAWTDRPGFLEYREGTFVRQHLPTDGTAR